MFKRGQVSIFIILGILIVTLSVLFFYISSQRDKNIIKGENKFNGYEILPIKEFTETCLKNAAIKGIFSKTGLHGGFISPEGDPAYGDLGVGEYSNQFTTFKNVQVPFHFVNNNADYPSLQAIEKKLANYIIVEFDKCLDYSIFENTRFEIIKPSLEDLVLNFDYSQSPIDSKVQVNEEDVTVVVEYPIIIRVDEMVSKLNHFQEKLPVRLKPLFESSEIVIEKIQQNSPNVYDLTADCSLYDKNGKTNVYSFVDDSGNYKIIQFVDFASYFDNFKEAFVFQFAVNDIAGECTA
jgi:hypothetical protein